MANLIISHVKKTIAVIAFILLALKSMAGIEPKSVSANYPFIINSQPLFTDLKVQDDKFGQTSDVKFQSGKGVVSLRVLDNVRLSYNFSYALDLQVTAYDKNGNANTTNPTLTVEYKIDQGYSYKGLDTYDLNDVYKIEVTITRERTINNSLTPPAGAVQLSARLVVNRRDINFTRTAIIQPTYQFSNSGTQKRTLDLSWSQTSGAEEHDIEWTTINSGNTDYTNAVAIKGSPSYDPASAGIILERIFRNNCSRVTTSGNDYKLPVIGTDDIMLVRIRAVSYPSAGLRDAGDWDYRQNDGSYSLFDIDWHQTNLNWQYSASYAEDGKRKEVISYFDGSLRGRQTVTINNSDNVEVAQENIYDEFGRPAASVLPAPVYDTSPFLHYLPGLNTTPLGASYTYRHLAATTGVNCELTPTALNTTTGASRYYSADNDFANLSNAPSAFKYIPDATLTNLTIPKPHEGYPFSVTQYTDDNTGRIRAQGGVGYFFQPGVGGNNDQSKTTKYYYGKPEQIELDQLFGSDAGTADHYSKNMVVDPNGQISVSYLNASGKTVATALAGEKPKSMDAVGSYIDPASITPTTIHLLQPEQFKFDASALKLSATTTFLAPLKDPSVQLSFSLQKLISHYPNTSTFSLCSNCYYKLTVTVTDNCGAVQGSLNAFEIGSKIADCNNAGEQTIPVNVTIAEPGEYQVKVELAYDAQAIAAYTDVFITQGLSHQYIEKQFDYIKQRYLSSIDASGCYNDCHTCTTLLGDKYVFVAQVKTKLLGMGLDTTSIVPGALHNWAYSVYADLKTKCDNLQAQCSYSPCESTRQVMLQDVSPGGQYALFTDDGQAVEPNVNVITRINSGTQPNYATVFGTMPPQADYDKSKVTLDDGTIASPYDPGFTLPQIIKYWKPEWAELFLKFHPEYCKLQFCENESNYKSWDQILQFDKVDASQVPGIRDKNNAVAGLSWNLGNAEDWLLNTDPFFNSTLSGNGAAYKSQMLADLQNYSQTVAQVPVTTDMPVKGLMAYTVYKLYCSNTGTSPSTTDWSGCGAPSDATCRVLDREWTTYASLYLALKDKYYNLLRAATTCPEQSCPVGTPVAYNPITPTCPPASEFTIDVVSDPATEAAGNQTVIVSHIGGAVQMAVGVGIYYPVTDDNNNSAYTHTVQFANGDASKTFTLPLSVQVDQLLIGGVACGGGNVISGDQFTVVEPGSFIYLDYSKVESDGFGNFNASGIIRLYNAAGSPLNAGPVGVSITLRYSNYIDEGDYDDVEYTIPAGQNSFEFSHFFQGDGYGYGGGGYFHRDLSCCSGYRFVDGVQGVTLCDPNYTPQPPPAPSGPTPCSNILAYKTTRFPEATAADFPSGPVDDVTVAHLQAQSQIDQQKVMAEQCEGVATSWVNALHQTSLDHAAAHDNVSMEDDYQNREAFFITHMAALKGGFMSICGNTASAENPAGTQDIPNTTNNYGTIIQNVLLGGGAFTMDFNPWLLSSPQLSGAPKAQSAPPTISNIYPDLCTVIGQLTTSAGGTGNLFSYLVNKYGSAMTLTQAEVNALQKSCSCNLPGGILNKDVTLPVFLDIPDSRYHPTAVVNPGVVTVSQFDAALLELQTKFGGGLDTVIAHNMGYPIILANFMNAKFGFNLPFNAYNAFMHPPHPDANRVLINQWGSPYVSPDPTDCFNSMLASAASSGLNAYNDYIVDLRRKFRDDYIAQCQLAQPSANIFTKQATYHYTLYYYDQADNLIRTIPPEGVRPLAGTSLLQVQQTRQYQSSGSTCTYSDAGVLNNQHDPAMTGLGTALQATGPVAIETWFYSGGTQLNQFQAVSTDQHWLYRITFSGADAGFDIFPLTPGSNAITFTPTSRHYRGTLPQSMVPLAPWTHAVVQGVNGISGTAVPELYVNGSPVQLTPSASPMAGGFRYSPGTSSPYSEDLTVLKHLRFYTRIMTPAEILADAQSNCFMPVNPAGMTAWYRFNIPAAGGPTTIAANSTDETRLQEIFPTHILPTSYAYNATNQVLHQNSPDGGLNNFWYDNVARLTYSQNAKQAVHNNYSYSLYDGFNRITEVGQTTLGSAPASLPYSINVAPYNTTIYNTNDTQITQTIYDVPASGSGVPLISAQSNLRKRVSASIYREDKSTPVVNGTYYNYDIDGNVKTLWQQIEGLTNAKGATPTIDALKRLDYDYDLISGKVNMLRYQHNYDPTKASRPDRFYYEYKYDAENRLIEAWSGTDVVDDINTGTAKLVEDYKRRDARYWYYLHGPLSRMELGDQLTPVQGLDYAYTLQGWLKGVNGQNLGNDVGGDGTLHTQVPFDAYAFSLGYYKDDYKPIGTGSSAFGTNYQPLDKYNTASDSGPDLFNGNISSGTMAIRALGSQTNGTTYRYDQLNRIKSVNRHNNINSNWDMTSIAPDYKEMFAYDGNGNITTAYRNGSGNQNIDNLVYNYYKTGNDLTNNRLKYVTNSGSSPALGVPTQGATNYDYDEIGNIKKDFVNNLFDVDWTVYGKIRGFANQSGLLLTDPNRTTYSYNATGQRVRKTVALKNTWYVRDPQGNDLAVYDDANSTINWKEQSLYGSSRLGTWAPNTGNINSTATADTNVARPLWLTTGSRQFALENHLSNVMATITDKRLQTADGSTTGYHYDADVASAQEYYAFGANLPGRSGVEVYTPDNGGNASWQSGNSNYRYGFNGKENDNDAKKDANGNFINAGQQDYGMRIYDPRVARFLSVDPLTPKYPELTPYQFASNTPIHAIDLDGLEAVISIPILGYKPKLKKSEWYDIQSPDGGYTDPATFGTAAKYNTSVNNPTAYEDIADRHGWYKWASKQVKAKDNYWFAAAADVTSLYMVGAADADVPNFGWLTNPEEELLSKANVFLLKENFKNFGPYVISDKPITWNGKSYGDLKGADLDNQMVVIEMTNLQGFLEKYKKDYIESHHSRNSWRKLQRGINDVFANRLLRGLTPESNKYSIEEFKKAFPGQKFDFMNLEHRIFKGQKMAEYLRAHPDQQAP